MSRPPLTRMQRGILEYIVSSVEIRGFPPTVREIAKQTELASISSVAHQIRRLVYKGYLKREFGISRGLRVIP